MTSEFLNFFSFVNDVQGLYQYLSQKGSGETNQRVDELDSRLFSVHQRVKNMTVLIREQVVRAGYVDDEKRIRYCYQLMKLGHHMTDRSQTVREKFLKATDNIDANVLHLLYGMLGHYDLADLLLTTIEAVQVFNQFRTTSDNISQQ